ncbi:hypothetical protein [Flavitalea sp.]|nr:hypothetical protein [Flavitalea sp.]
MVGNSGIAYKLLYRILMYIFVPLTLVSCSGKNGKSFLPEVPGYDSKNRQVFILHKQLLEISGITYINNRTLSAINDEDGKIFRVDFGDGKPSAINFGGEKDYEDIAVIDSSYYVMESNGNINVVPVNDPSNSRKITFKKKSKIEFESLYYDKTTGKLVLLSKEQRMIQEAIVAYSFDPLSEKFSSEPVYIISLRAVKKLMKDYSAECKPSGASVHPVLNKLFVIASIGKVLMICSLKGEVEKVYSLNPDIFSQPEGICFSPEGDMFISNEGLQGKATIIKFSYQPDSKPGN